MIYPNGFISLEKLRKMINSKEFDIYYEDPVEVPEDYDFPKQGIPRGAQHRLRNKTSQYNKDTSGNLEP